MTDRLRRYWLWIVLAIALLINVYIYWPRKHSTAMNRPPFPPEAGPVAANDSSPAAQAREARFQAALEKLPAAERKALEDRREADRIFFASIQNLPESERRQKMEEHFQQNPPPAGLLAGGPPPGPPPSDGSGGGPSSGNQPNDNSGDGSHGPGAHIPPPDVRRSMDQHIADSQRSGN